jgi:hypothetical protein
VEIQHYRKIQQFTVTPCGNTTLLKDSAIYSYTMWKYNIIERFSNLQLHHVEIQHYRKIQQSTATPCGNTTL